MDATIKPNMKKPILVITLILSFSFPAMNADAIFLIDKEVKVVVPGGKTQTLLVNNFSGKVVQYRTAAGWTNENADYMNTLQRLVDLQKSRADIKPGYHYYNK
jgi:flagellar motor component MotA